MSLARIRQLSFLWLICVVYDIAFVLPYADIIWLQGMTFLPGRVWPMHTRTYPKLTGKLWRSWTAGKGCWEGTSEWLFLARSVVSERVSNALDDGVPLENVDISSLFYHLSGQRTLSCVYVFVSGSASARSGLGQGSSASVIPCLLFSEFFRMSVWKLRFCNLAEFPISTLLLETKELHLPTINKSERGLSCARTDVKHYYCFMLWLKNLFLCKQTCTLIRADVW